MVKLYHPTTYKMGMAELLLLYRPVYNSNLAGQVIHSVFNIIIVSDKPGFRHIRRDRSQTPLQTGVSVFPVFPFA